MIKNIKLLLICLVVICLISCEKSPNIIEQNKEEVSKMKGKLNRNLMNLHIDSDYLFDPSNSLLINESLAYTDTLLKISNSERKYFYSLIKSKLLFLKKEKDESIKALQKFELANPLLYNYFYGIINELSGSQKGAVSKYLIANDFCINDYDILCYQIQFLIDNDVDKFLSSLKKLDNSMFVAYKLKLEKSITIDNFRKNIIVSNFFDQFILPNDDGVVDEIKKYY